MDRKHTSGQPRNVSTEENIVLIEELVCSQDDQTNRSQLVINKENGEKKKL